MSLTGIFAIVWFLVLALAVNVTISVSSINNSQDLGYIKDVYEISTEYYLFVTGTPKAVVYDYNTTTGYVSLQQNGFVYNIFMGPKNQSTILAIGLTVKPEAMQFGANYRLINYNYWACLNINDPIGYSRRETMIFITSRSNATAPHTSCTRVWLTMNFCPQNTTNCQLPGTQPAFNSNFGSSTVSNQGLNLKSALIYQHSVYALIISALLAYTV